MLEFEFYFSIKVDFFIIIKKIIIIIMILFNKVKLY